MLGIDNWTPSDAIPCPIQSIWCTTDINNAQQTVPLISPPIDSLYEFDDYFAVRVITARGLDKLLSQKSIPLSFKEHKTQNRRRKQPHKYIPKAYFLGAFVVSTEIFRFI